MGVFRGKLWKKACGQKGERTMAGLSVKELAALEQQLDRERTLRGKAKRYAEEVSDPQIRAKLEQAAACHQEHFLRLLNLLNQGGK